jgi:hypothetical protein
MADVGEHVLCLDAHIHEQRLVTPEAYLKYRREHYPELRLDQK